MREIQIRTTWIHGDSRAHDHAILANELERHRTLQSAASFIHGIRSHHQLTAPQDRTSCEVAR